MYIYICVYIYIWIRAYVHPKCQLYSALMGWPGVHVKGPPDNSIVAQCQFWNMRLLTLWLHVSILIIWHNLQGFYRHNISFCRDRKRVKAPHRKQRTPQACVTFAFEGRCRTNESLLIVLIAAALFSSWCGSSLIWESWLKFIKKNSIWILGAQVFKQMSYNFRLLLPAVQLFAVLSNHSKRHCYENRSISASPKQPTSGGALRNCISRFFLFKVAGYFLAWSTWKVDWFNGSQLPCMDFFITPKKSKETKTSSPQNQLCRILLGNTKYA